MKESVNILYVDDDRDVRTIVGLSLGLDKNVDVRTVETGAEAVSIASSSAWKPEVFVLDVMMPDMDGLVTLKALRNLPGHATTPAIFMTARGRDEDVVRYRAEGAIGVILKPFDPIFLVGEIRNLLSRGNEGVENPV